MKTQTTEHYIGTVTEVLDSRTYEIHLSIPGVLENALGVPYRGELDEPKPGNLILCDALDPVHKTVFLYRKLKENEFLGIRSNGKMINITPEFIDIAVFDPEMDYPDSYVPNGEDITSHIQITHEGDIIIDSAKSITLIGDGDIKISTDSGKIGLKASEIDLDCDELKITADTKFTPGSTFDLTGGTVSTFQPGGPFNTIATCFNGTPIGGTKVRF